MKLELIRFFKVESPLLQFAKNVTSQNGEDGIIEHIVEVIAPEHKYCVEFGAWDGKHFSNCFNLLTNRAWKGAMIEANTDKFQQLKATYSAAPQVACINKLVEFEGENSLDNILGQVDAPKDIGVLSIDIDGNDYYVWESLKKFTPELVIIEFNPTIPNDVIFVQERSINVSQGCSLLSLVCLGREMGYELACCTAWNAFFVKKAKLGALGVKNNFIYNLYAPIQDGRIFQGYDSYVHVLGMDSLIWKGGTKLASGDFQVLPESLRSWGDAQTK